MDDDSRDIDGIGRLIRYSGPREAVSDERARAARQRVDSHWRQVVAANRRGARWPGSGRLAVAASVLVAVAIGVFMLRPEPVATRAATIQRIDGMVQVDGRAASVGDPVAADSVIETVAGSRVALAMASGHAVRLDEATRFVAGRDRRHWIERGAVYVDSGTPGNAGSLAIESVFGSVADVGTQFQVRLGARSVAVAVREGLVDFRRDNGSAIRIESGLLYEVTPAGESSQPLGSDDVLWNWTQSVVVAIDIEGLPLDDYLRWYSRERGVELVWDDVSAANAAGIRLSSSLEGLTLDEGLALVSRIASFEYELAAGELRVTVE